VLCRYGQRVSLEPLLQKGLALAIVLAGASVSRSGSIEGHAMPLIFRQLQDLKSSTFTYLLADSTTREAVLIDPVFEQARRDSALLRELELRLVCTLDTHVGSLTLRCGYSGNGPNPECRERARRSERSGDAGSHQE
jgi:hypothetical protein